MTKQYRQKDNPDSMVLEGIEWTGSNVEELRSFISDRYYQITDHALIINKRTVGNETRAPLGAVIVRDAEGEYVAVDKNLVEEV